MKAVFALGVLVNLGVLSACVHAGGEYPQARGAIKGAVVGCDPAGTENLALYTPGYSHYVKPDAQGRFHLGQVPGGEYRLALAVDGHVMHTRSVGVQAGQVTEVGRIDLAADMACPAVFEPVCGDNGKTYGNACEAHLACMRIAYRGECE